MSSLVYLLCHISVNISFVYTFQKNLQASVHFISKHIYLYCIINENSIFVSHSFLSLPREKLYAKKFVFYLVSFNKYMYLCDPNYYQDIEHSCHLRKFPHDLSQSIPIPLSQRKVHCDFLVYVSFSCSTTLYT